MTASAASIASTALGLGRGRISWPYGLMYQIRLMRAGSGSSDSLEKAMLGWRRVERDPGRLASSIVVSALTEISAGCSALRSFNAVGWLGWLIAFWPVMIVPSARPAEMWWEKLLMMAGRTAVLDSSTPPMMARR